MAIISPDKVTEAVAPSGMVKFQIHLPPSYTHHMLIKIESKDRGHQSIWNLAIPEGATAAVTLPGETTATEYNAGSYTIEK